MEIASRVILLLLLPLFNFVVAQNASRGAQEFHVGGILDLETMVGKIARTSISLAMEDFYAVHQNYSTKLVLHIRDSMRDDVRAASQGTRSELLSWVHCIGLFCFTFYCWNGRTEHSDRQLCILGPWKSRIATFSYCNGNSCWIWCSKFWSVVVDLLVCREATLTHSQELLYVSASNNATFTKPGVTRNSTSLETLKTSGNGPKLLQEILQNQFEGLSGNFDVSDRQLQQHFRDQRVTYILWSGQESPKRYPGVLRFWSCFNFFPFDSIDNLFLEFSGCWAHTASIFSSFFPFLSSTIEMRGFFWNVLDCHHISKGSSLVLIENRLCINLLASFDIKYHFCKGVIKATS